MAREARTYNYYGTAAPKRAPRRERQTSPRTDVRVIEGGAVAHKTLPPALVTGFKVAMAIVVALIVVCAIRVWLSASTVQALQNVEVLQTSVEKAYAASSELEIEHSVLANPTRIQREAKSMGMSTPSKKVYLKVRLSPKFAYNDNGSVSLKETIKNIKGSNAVPSK